MHRWIQYLGIVIILFSFFLAAFSASDVYSQQIISGNFSQDSTGIYISPEINIWIRSTGEIQWSSSLHDAEFYLIPAPKISELNRNDADHLAIPPIKYAGGTDTYLYQDLSGSYYVVAISAENPSSYTTYIFSHPPYPSDELVGGPNNYNTAQHVLIYSVLLIFLGFSMIFAEPTMIKARRIRSKGDSLSRLTLNYFHKRMRGFASSVNAHRVVSLILVLIMIFALFTIAQGRSVPKVFPILPVETVHGSNLSGNYTDNLSFWAYSPAVSAKYFAIMIGPLPRYGGINSSTIYVWDYSVTIIKIAQNTSFPWSQQTLTISNVTVSIGKYLLPFRENKWDSGLVYFNGGVVTNQSGTFDTGSEYGIQVEPVNEISCNIPDGNYTMNIHIKLEPVSVMGPYHINGKETSIGITFPVYINNSNVINNPV